jgi:hypothetical protein
MVHSGQGGNQTQAHSKGDGGKKGKGAQKISALFSKKFCSSGLGPTNKNTLKNSLNSCQIFRLLKMLSNISDCVHMKQY